MTWERNLLCFTLQSCAQYVQHVLDSSAANLEEQRQAVLDVLRQIGVSDKNVQDMIEVWNKVLGSLSLPILSPSLIVLHDV